MSVIAKTCPEPELDELLLSNRAQIDDLIRGIGAPDDDCDPISWIEDAISFGYKLVSVKSASGKPVGFVSFDELHRCKTVGVDRVAKCSYILHAVYVNNCCRRSGYGMALREAITSALDQSIKALQRQGGIDKIEVFIEAECISEAGAVFARELFEDCELICEQHAQNRLLAITIKDCIDYDDFGTGYSPTPKM